MGNLSFFFPPKYPSYFHSTNPNSPLILESVKIIYKSQKMIGYWAECSLLLCVNLNSFYQYLIYHKYLEIEYYFLHSPFYHRIYVRYNTGPLHILFNITEDILYNRYQSQPAHFLASPCIRVDRGNLLLPFYFHLKRTDRVVPHFPRHLQCLKILAESGGNSRHALFFYERRNKNTESP